MMSKWKLFTGIVLVFVLGILVGSLGMGLYFKQRVLPPRADPKPRKAFLMERLTRDLELTEDQEAKFEKIFAELEKRRRQYRSELKKIKVDAFSKMRNELSAEQQKKMDKMREAFKRRKKKRRESF